MPRRLASLGKARSLPRVLNRRTTLGLEGCSTRRGPLRVGYGATSTESGRSQRPPGAGRRGEASAAPARTTRAQRRLVPPENGSLRRRGQGHFRSAPFIFLRSGAEKQMPLCGRGITKHYAVLSPGLIRYKLLAAGRGHAEPLRRSPEEESPLTEGFSSVTSAREGARVRHHRSAIRMPLLPQPPTAGSPRPRGASDAGPPRTAWEASSPRRSLESADHAGAGGMLDPGVVH
jgi:hypothetical protein